MNSLKERQRQLLDYLRGHSSDIAAHIGQQGNISTELRLGIYHNAYRVRLRETLDSDLPVLGQYLGDDLYRQMVAGYIEQYPSRYRSLRHFADNLPAFLASQAPFCEHPQIAGLARFERLLMDVFDAPDATQAELSELQQLPAEQWPGLHLRFHPGLQLFSSDYNVVEIWQALKAERPPPPLRQRENHWMLWRNRQRLTEFSSLDAPERLLLQRFLQGDTLAGAADHLLQLIPEQEAGALLFETLQQWLNKGLICRLI
ncbi:HvfC/BufC N-terminal domain-containing protein [Marinobacterium jannaschii]|uniref:HvfC/BufC N-terminal domain-containing protein n=1 Tax=Marinobacterium jannaschii TaxID=64970 RepID=UPI00048A0614|nr:putative DNA-binding domain-containing protein [Marinobacterium jannaschii]